MVTQISMKVVKEVNQYTYGESFTTLNKNFSSLFMPSLFLAKRLVLVLLYINFVNYPSLQIMAIIYMQLAYIIMLLVSKERNTDGVVIELLN